MAKDVKEVLGVRISPEVRQQLQQLQARWACEAPAAVEGAIRLTHGPCAGWAMALLGLDNHSQGLRQQQHLEAWALALDIASAEIAERFTPNEWCAIADATNGTLMLSVGSHPGMLLSANVADGITLNRLDVQHELTPEQSKTLPARLRDLGYTQAWAVSMAVEWLFAHPDVSANDPWWTPAFRREWQRDNGGK